VNRSSSPRNRFDRLLSLIILMSVQRVGISLVGVALLTLLVVAVATVWLYLTNPITIVNAVNEGDVSPFVRDLARVILDALQGLLKYL
jgi:hypothetical protein